MPLKDSLAFARTLAISILCNIVARTACQAVQIHGEALNDDALGYNELNATTSRPLFAFYAAVLQFESACYHHDDKLELAHALIVVDGDIRLYSCSLISYSSGVTS